MIQWFKQLTGCEWLLLSVLVCSLGGVGLGSASAQPGGMSLVPFGAEGFEDKPDPGENDACCFAGYDRFSIEEGSTVTIKREEESYIYCYDEQDFDLRARSTLETELEYLGCGIWGASTTLEEFHWGGEFGCEDLETDPFMISHDLYIQVRFDGLEWEWRYAVDPGDDEVFGPEDIDGVGWILYEDDALVGTPQGADLLAIFGSGPGTSPSSSPYWETHTHIDPDITSVYVLTRPSAGKPTHEETSVRYVMTSTHTNSSTGVSRFESSISTQGIEERTGEPGELGAGCCSSCSTCGEGTGGEASASLGDDGEFELDVNLGMQSGSNGPYGAGRVRLSASSFSSALTDPASLELISGLEYLTTKVTRNATTGVLEEVDGSYSDLKVATITGGFALEFRTNGAPGTDEPYALIEVTSPGADRLLVVKSEGVGGATAPTVTETWEFVYSSVSGVDSWEMARGVDATNGGVATADSREKVERETLGNGDIQITRAVMEADGTVVSEDERTYRAVGGEERVVEYVIDPSGAALTRTWTYYGDGDGVTSSEAHYGYLKSYVSETGYWEHYLYNTEGEMEKLIRQHGSNDYLPANLTTLESNNQAVIRTEHEDLDLDRTGYPAQVTAVEMQEVVQGTVERTSYEIIWPEPDSDVVTDWYLENWAVACAEADPAATNHSGDVEAYLDALATDVLAGTTVPERVTRTYRHQRGNQIYANRLYQVIAPDGRLTQYEYPTIRQRVRYSGYPGAWRQTTTDLDSQGQTESTLVEYSTDSDLATATWFEVSEVVHSNKDSKNRYQTTSYSFGGDPAAYTTSMTYGCCGVEDRTDREGVVASFVYDDLKRTIASTRFDGDTNGFEITTYTTYDAAGRVETVVQDPTDVTGSITTRTMTYDLAGRTTSVEDALGNMMFYTYRDVETDGDAYVSGARYHERRVYPHDKASGPIQVTWTDSHGRVVRQFVATTTAADWNGSAPTGSEALTEQGRSVAVYDWAGRQTAARVYHTLPGIAQAGSSSDYYESTFEYDVLGRQVRSEDASGNVSISIYDDETGRMIQQWVGTDSTGWTTSDPSNGGAGGNNMVMVSQMYYDTNRDGTGDLRDYATRVETLKPLATLGTVDDYTHLDTDRLLDANGMTVRTMPEVGPWSEQVSDHQGRMLESSAIKNGNTTFDWYLSQTTYQYDSSKPWRMIATRQQEVNPATGALVGNYIETTYGFDAVARRFMTTSPSGAVSATLYDAYGRTERQLVTSGDIGVVGDPTDDVVISETEFGYDDSGRTITTAFYDRLHDAGSTTGLLSLPANSSLMRPRYTATWYDDAGRATHTADYGDTSP